MSHFDGDPTKWSPTYCLSRATAGAAGWDGMRSVRAKRIARGLVRAAMPSRTRRWVEMRCGDMTRVEDARSTVGSARRRGTAMVCAVVVAVFVPAMTLGSTAASAAEHADATGDNCKAYNAIEWCGPDISFVADPILGGEV